MIKTGFKVNGRSVRPGQLGRELKNAMTKQLEDSVKKTVSQTVSQVRCRTHGQLARVTFHGRALSDMKFDVSGCCDDLVQEVRQRLGRR